MLIHTTSFQRITRPKIRTKSTSISYRIPKFMMRLLLSLQRPSLSGMQRRWLSWEIWSSLGQKSMCSQVSWIPSSSWNVTCSTHVLLRAISHRQSHLLRLWGKKLIKYLWNSSVCRLKYTRSTCSYRVSLSLSQLPLTGSSPVYALALCMAPWLTSDLEWRTLARRTKKITSCSWTMAYWWSRSTQVKIYSKRWIT
jgi:hypothetical protein